MNSKPPKHLTRNAKLWWTRLQTEYDILDMAGFLLLQTAMEAFDRMCGAQAVIAKEGMQIADRFGQMKAHPLTTVERDARSAMVQALKALNLDVEPLNNRPGRQGGK